MAIGSQADALAAMALEQEMRKRAARQAAGALANPQAVEKVRVRVLKLGDGKIAMGVHIAGIGDAHYERGEQFDIELPIAQSLEDKGYVEIEGEATGEASTVELAMQSAAQSALAQAETDAAQRTAERAASEARADGDAAIQAAAEAAKAAAALVAGSDGPPINGKAAKE